MIGNRVNTRERMLRPSALLHSIKSSVYAIVISNCFYCCKVFLNRFYTMSYAEVLTAKSFGNVLALNEWIPTLPQPT